MLARLFDPTDPFSLFDVFERQMRDVPARTDRGAGAFSVHEEADAFTVRGTLPGYAKDDVAITFEGDVLTVKAERKLDVPKEFKLLRSERGGSRVEQQITLPVAIHADAIDASMEDGLLTITLPKAPEAKPRKIALRGTSASELS